AHRRSRLQPGPSAVGPSPWSPASRRRDLLVIATATAAGWLSRSMGPALPSGLQYATTCDLTEVVLCCNHISCETRALPDERARRMVKRTSHKSANCPVARPLDAIGDWWS